VVEELRSDLADLNSPRGSAPFKVIDEDNEPPPFSGRTVYKLSKFFSDHLN
jgi:hypothetical protein